MQLIQNNEDTSKNNNVVWTPITRAIIKTDFNHELIQWKPYKLTKNLSVLNSGTLNSTQIIIVSISKCIKVREKTVYNYDDVTDFSLHVLMKRFCV